MNRPTLEWYEQMSRGLVWAGAVVLVLAVVAAIIIAGSDSAAGIFGEEIERQGRGVFALASLGGGLTCAGLLAGVGAILRLLVSERLEKLGPPPAAEAAAAAGSATRRPAPRREPARRPSRRRSATDDSEGAADAGDDTDSERG